MFNRNKYQGEKNSDEKDFFRFKHLRLRNRDAAFKINTDGVLLGTWVEGGEDNNLLEIGTGTGVIALMLAQKFPLVQITAIELDDASYQEAVYNFQLNNKLIEVFHQPLQTFAESKRTFDHIVSNPPYYEDNSKAIIPGKNISKHNETLDFSTFWMKCAKLSHDHSRVSVIIPYSVMDRFLHLAKAQKFQLYRCCKVKSRVSSDWIRVLLEFRRCYEGSVLSDEMHLQEEGRNNWSPRYRAMAKDFYLNA